MLKRLRVLESFVNVDSSVVRCLALAVLQQHSHDCGLGLQGHVLGRGLDTSGLINIVNITTSRLQNSYVTQCYLLPGRHDIHAFTPAEAGARFSDSKRMKG